MTVKDSSFSFLQKCFMDNYKENKEYLIFDEARAYKEFLELRNNPNIVFSMIYKNQRAVGYYAVSSEIEEKAKPFVDYIITDIYIIPKERNQGIASSFLEYIINNSKFKMGLTVPDECLKMRRMVEKLAKKTGKKLRKSHNQYPEYSISKLYVFE